MPRGDSAKFRIVGVSVAHIAGAGLDVKAWYVSSPPIQTLFEGKIHIRIEYAYAYTYIHIVKSIFQTKKK